MLRIPQRSSVRKREHSNFITRVIQQDPDLTWAPVLFWCSHQGGPYGWSWSPPRKGNHQGRWPGPQGRTASCPVQRRCSWDHRGRSGKNHSPSQCWLPEAAGTGTRSPHFLCEGPLRKKISCMLACCKVVIHIVRFNLVNEPIQPDMVQVYWDCHFCWAH